MGKIIDLDPDVRARARLDRDDLERPANISCFPAVQERRKLSRFNPEMEGNRAPSEVPDWLRRDRQATRRAIEAQKETEQKKWREKII